ncbi:MAG: 4-phosphoerythronate dehydrogenase [Proteobacteria bacterium]|nr:4-phosphoerythronate dehydrogenase [Pseudomonadota bacterium]
MKIIADENIPFVEDAFHLIGKVTTLANRDINNNILLDADILLVRSVTQVNRQLLHNTPVKIVATATSGVNHIDINYLRQQNIHFASAPGSNANSVAQYVISAICYWSLQQQRATTNLSLGIIGYGYVGKKVKQLAQLLKIKCVVNDPPLAELDPDGLSSLKDTLKCDIVSVHVPLTTSAKYPTIKLLNEQKIQCLQKNCLLINSSRGEVIDEQALLTRKIQHNDLSLVLDVWEHEPDINHNMIAQTLISTPHIAGYSFDAKLKGTEIIYQACCNLLNLPITWSIANNIYFGENKTTNINHTKPHDIRQAILAAYDIVADSKQLKLVLEKPHLSTRHHFDSLRKNYPARREWVW